MTTTAAAEAALADGIATAIMDALRGKMDGRLSFETPEAIVHRAAMMVAQIVLRKPGPIHPFQRVGYGRTKKELRRVVKAKGRPAQLKLAVSFLHAPAIDCLGEIGWTRCELLAQPTRSASAAERALNILEDVDLSNNVHMKPRNLKVIALTKVIAHLYEELTDRKPTWEENGKFLDLLRAVHTSVSEDWGNLEGYARVAIRERRENRRGNFL